MTSSGSSGASDPVLVLNGAEERVQVALGDGRGVLRATEMRVPSQAMRYLPPALEVCLREAGLAPADLKGVACVRGPGTFTGLRVVMAVAMGVARGGSLPVAGLDYLPLLAQGPCRLFPGEVWVCTYARKGLAYVQGFAGPGAEPLVEPAAMSRERAAEVIRARREPVALLGSAVRRDPGFWAAQLPAADVLEEPWDHPAPERLLHAALAARFVPEPLQPLYLRVSDAEANLERIAESRGLDPETARKRVHQP
jgi:tRNA threonylcarbamoyl adenosine modification protein YeaZ